MSRDDATRNPDEQQALDALRSLPRARAGAAARSRARQAFLEAASPVQEIGDAPAAPTAPRRRGNFWVPLAAAAVIAMAVFGIWQTATGPSMIWRVTDVVAAEGVQGLPEQGDIVDARTLVTGPESEVELQLGQELRLRVIGGSQVDLPAPPRRWRPGPMELAVREGEVYGTTAGTELTVPLLLRGTYSEAEITGTTFAMFETEDGTCVCLWEGSITLRNLTSDEVYELEPRTRFWVYTDGTPSGPQPLDQMETMKLQMTSDAGLLPPETP
jgi:ferric-dicitrate binding protein FerR (iron transport regulator)